MIADGNDLWAIFRFPTATRRFPSLGAHVEACGTSNSLGRDKRDRYLLGSYRIATAPEPNSSRLTSFKSTCLDNSANNVGPWPASLGWTTNSY